MDPDETYGLPALYSTSSLSLSETYWPSADLELHPQKPLFSPSDSHHPRLREGQETSQPHHQHHHRAHSRTPSHPSPQSGVASTPSHRGDSAHGRRSSQDMADDLQYRRHQRRSSDGPGPRSPEAKHAIRSPHNGAAFSPTSLLRRHRPKHSARPHGPETLEPLPRQSDGDTEQEEEEGEEEQEQEQGANESTPTSRKGPEVMQLLDVTGRNTLDTRKV